ncbi:MAG TPA: TIR domain-containing protein [Polyangiaceae bacterium]|nr:TIR domain-containing protein [Polyangiaceae bacterium]
MTSGTLCDLTSRVSPDGRRIVSASEDNTLKVWDVATGACEVTIHGVAPFRCVAVTPDLLCAGNYTGDLWVLETTSRPERPTSTTRPLRLFYSYSHKDEALRDELETHLVILKRQGLIEQWHDRRIEPGTNWAGAIDSNLEKADILLLLVSADFIASPYCYEKEMQRALERHRASQARVIPILLRPTDFKGAPFEKLQALPKDTKPVTSWEDRDEAWTDVVDGIRLVVESLRASKR